MTFIEFELRQICKYIQEKKQIPWSIADLKGSNDINKAKLYLHKTLNINFGEMKEWDQIIHLWTIRNAFVHHSGSIAKKKGDNLRKHLHITSESFCMQPQEESKGHYIIIIPDRKLGDFAITLAEKFFEKLLIKLES